MISAIFFSLAANIDNIAIGISYGIKKIHISNKNSILISVFTSVITLIAMLVGKLLTNFLGFNSIANIVGASALIILGILGIIKSFVSQKKDSLDNRKLDMSLKNTLQILFILSSNNIASGFAASIAGINIICTVISTFIIGYLFLIIGNSIGKNIINSYILKYSDLFSSLILVLLGIFEFLFK